LALREKVKGVSTRAQNEKKFGRWNELPGSGRRYHLSIIGRLGWQLLTSKKWM
jgi:hypothetical protein